MRRPAVRAPRPTPLLGAVPAEYPARTLFLPPLMTPQVMSRAGRGTDDGEHESNPLSRSRTTTRRCVPSCTAFDHCTSQVV